MDCVHCVLHDYSRVVAAVTDPASIRHYLVGTGQCAEVPALAPARAPPQAELDFDCYSDVEVDYEVRDC